MLFKSEDTLAIKLLNSMGSQFKENLCGHISGTWYGYDTGKTGAWRIKQPKEQEEILISDFGAIQRDLTEAAREDRLDPVVGRNAEVERVMQILCRRMKNNPCLVGEPGVGKTAVVEGWHR